MNHKLVPISHKLRSGDQIEIITSNKQKPTEDWLNNVVTAKAKNSIKDALREEKKIISEEGKYTLQRKLEGIGASYQPYNIDQLMHFYKMPSQLDLLYKIATKSIDLKELKSFLVLGDKIEASILSPRTRKLLSSLRSIDLVAILYNKSNWLGIL